MTHLASSLPREVEIGAVRREDWNTEIVETLGGYEERNNPWATPLLMFEINYPPSERDDANYLAIIQLFGDAEGSLHSFNFTDWTDETGATIIPVRFDSPLEIVGIAGHLDHIVNIALKEVRVDEGS